MISQLVSAGILALVCAAPAATPAAARTIYDGAWSVLIVTDSGSCDRAYRYGVHIVDGRVVYDGGVVNMSGRVAPNGRVVVTVSAGGQSASGSGRLSRNSGGGSWRGRGSSGGCSGSWSAERRG